MSSWLCANHKTGGDSKPPWTASALNVSQCLIYEATSNQSMDKSMRVALAAELL